MSTRVILLIPTFVVALAAPVFWRARISYQASDEIQTRAAVSDLWAAEEAKRLAAKDKLLEIGPSATKYLIPLLDDILERPHPRFPLGKEREGAEAMGRYLESARLGSEVDRRIAGDQLAALDITNRLKVDIIDLLGRLKAPDAIPVLIKAMWLADIWRAKERMNEAMSALAEFGSVALPKLIEAIQSARSTAENVRYSDDLALSADEKNASIEIDMFKIQARAAIVLGKIGDPQAIPVLEDLAATTTNQFTRRYVRAAIDEIANKDRPQRSRK